MTEPIELVSQGYEVRIKVPMWAGVTGRLEDAVPLTPWFNVRVKEDLRLMLKADELEIRGKRSDEYWRHYYHHSAKSASHDPLPVPLGSEGS